MTTNFTQNDNIFHPGPFCVNFWNLQQLSFSQLETNHVIQEPTVEYKTTCRPPRKDFNPIVCSPCTFQVCTLEKPLSDLDSASMPNIYTKITSLKVCTVKICIYKILKKKEKGMLCMGLFINTNTLLVKFRVVREISPLPYILARVKVKPSPS